MTGTEACDDGNMRTGDGCNNNCEIENHDTCDVSGMSIGKDSIIIRGTTAGSIDDIKTTAMVDGCNAATWPGGDLVYIVKPLFAGNLTVTLEAKYAVHLLHIRTACPGGESDEIGCQHGALATAADVSTVSVDAGNVYYIVVDSYAGTSGPFVLTLSLQ